MGALEVIFARRAGEGLGVTLAGRLLVILLDTTLRGWRTLGLTLLAELPRPGSFEMAGFGCDLVERTGVITLVRVLATFNDR